MWPNPMLHAVVDVACSVWFSSDTLVTGIHWAQSRLSSIRILADRLYPLASIGSAFPSLSLWGLCSSEFMQHTYSHTCMIEHWQQLLWNCLGLRCFCVFSWQLKHLAYIKLPWSHGQINLVCCIGHRDFRYPNISPSLTSLGSELPL